MEIYCDFTEFFKLLNLIDKINLRYTYRQTNCSIAIGLYKEYPKHPFALIIQGRESFGGQSELLQVAGELAKYVRYKNNNTTSTLLTADETLNKSKKKQSELRELFRKLSRNQEFDKENWLLVERIKEILELHD